MSGEVEKMAYVGETPWHGLGNKLPKGTSIEVWQKAAGLDWKILRSQLYFDVPVLDTKGREVKGETSKVIAPRDALYRSDTGKYLAAVSDHYKPVQPGDVLEFFRDLVQGSDFSIETAGCLKGGQRIWALASADDIMSIQTKVVSKGKKADIVKPYLLLASGTDRSMGTHAGFTTVRVVCNNTLEASFNAGGVSRVSRRHTQEFDAKGVKAQLGLADKAFAQFKKTAEQMANHKVSKAEAVEFFVRLLAKGDEEVQVSTESEVSRNVRKLTDLYLNGPGAELPTAKGTAWGLVNAVTRFADFDARAKSQDSRLDSAWFGTKAKLKKLAVARALELAA
jgi:phage/plasmid-like protein (TIGR03299 family)